MGVDGKARFYLFLTFLGCFALGVLSRSTPTPESPPSKPLQPVKPYVEPYLTYELIEAHNRERATQNRAPLEPDLKLIAAARKHADHMAARGKMAHSGIGDGDPAERATREGYRYAGMAENVAWNYRDVPTVMVGWMMSPGHRLNILGGYTHMGAAVSYARDGSPYWCAVFGSPAP